jgi:tetratricopeptide (TPR) repeat protein
MLGEALHVYEQLVAEVPSAPDSDLRELLEARHELEVVLFGSGRLPEAEAGRLKSLEMAKKLAVDFPSTHQFRYLIALNYQRLGEVLCEAGRLREAETTCRQALASASELAAFPAPESLGALYGRVQADCQNGLADLLVAFPSTDSRDATEAICLAQRAVELYPKRGQFLWTLGVAYYRAGQWDAAVRALEKSAELHNSGDCDYWFFLAMAHWQLGHKREARRFYDRAVASMEANKHLLEKFKILNARACRFRGEAECLLGIRSDSPNRKKE